MGEPFAMVPRSPPASWWKWTSWHKQLGYQVQRNFPQSREVAQRFCNNHQLLRFWGSFFSGGNHFPFFSFLTPQSRSHPQEQEVPSGGCRDCHDIPLPPHGDGFVAGRSECPCCPLELQLRVSGCDLAPAKSNHHWALDHLLCPVEVCFYSSISSGGKK